MDDLKNETKPTDDTITGDAREQWLARSGEITRVAHLADKLAMEARGIAYDISHALDKPLPEARKILDATTDRIEAIRAKLAAVLK